MRLAEAILLGDSLRKRDPNWFLFKGSGCAIGGAWLAVGKDSANQIVAFSVSKSVWPWLTLEIHTAIGIRFHCVCAGTGTIEQLADWVDSIDPTPRETVSTVEATEVEPVEVTAT